ncbi:winged helix-turn-helix domain-containing protein [Flavitalea antarctica]
MSLIICFIGSSFTEHADRDLRAKQMNLIIRQIGHRLLWQGGDSTSRVLPVTEIKEGTFRLRFENKLVFNHDSLMELIIGALPRTQFPAGYTVTVHDCTSGGIVYGFQVNNDSPDLVACKGRVQPEGCYTIEFAFPRFYETVKTKKNDSGHLTGKLMEDAASVNPTLAGSKTATRDKNTEKSSGESNSVSVDSVTLDREPEQQTKSSNVLPVTMLYGGLFMLVLLAISLVIGTFRKSVTAVTGSSQPEQVINDQVIINESMPELPMLGKFLFNVKDQRLLSGNEVVNLTDKECKVLDLLHKNFGELIPRDTLMQEVWINEGVITGRSLDMFISKLRKKLSPDPDLRITNVHGKGYKLEKAIA